MGGATTNITAVKHGLAKYDPNVVQGTVLDRKEIDRQIDLYRSMDAAGRRGVVGLQPKRAEVILAGACIIRTSWKNLARIRLPSATVACVTACSRSALETERSKAMAAKKKAMKKTR